jgi:hypothetical protein
MVELAVWLREAMDLETRLAALEKRGERGC